MQSRKDKAKIERASLAYLSMVMDGRSPGTAGRAVLDIYQRLSLSVNQCYIAIRLGRMRARAARVFNTDIMRYHVERIASTNDGM